MKQIYGLYILQWRQFFIIQYPGVVYFYPSPSENTFRELFGAGLLPGLGLKQTTLQKKTTNVTRSGSLKKPNSLGNNGL